MSCRIRAVEHRKCVAGPAGAHLGLQDRILLNYTRMENVHEVRKKTFNFLLCIEAEPSSESGQKEGFTFVRGALRSCKGAWHSNLTKIPLICSVSYFNLGGIGALSGGAKPTKTTRGDGTVKKSSKLLVFLFPCGGFIKFLNASMLKKLFLCSCNSITLHKLLM